MQIIYITILTVIAGGVGTLTGFGTSTIMVPVLLLFFPLAPTLLLVGIIHWFGNIWKMALFRQGVRWRLIMLFGVPGVLLTFLGARLVYSAPEKSCSRGFSAAFWWPTLLFFFFNPSFKLRQNALTATLGGALSRFFAGVFGVGGAIRSAFLAAFNLPKVVYIATAGAIGLAIDTARIGTYLAEGTVLPPNLLWGSLLFIPASFVGAQLAKRVVDKIPQQQFRMLVALFLLVVGIKLLIFA